MKKLLCLVVNMNFMIFVQLNGLKINIVALYVNKLSLIIEITLYDFIQFF